MVVLGFVIGVAAVFIARAIADAFAPDDAPLPTGEQPRNVRIVTRAAPYDWSRDD